MTRKDAIRKIMRIIDETLGGKTNDVLIEHMAERIYADVLSPAVDDEREKWIEFGFTPPHGRNLH